MADHIKDGAVGFHLLNSRDSLVSPLLTYQVREVVHQSCSDRRLQLGPDAEEAGVAVGDKDGKGGKDEGSSSFSFPPSSLSAPPSGRQHGQHGRKNVVVAGTEHSNIPTPSGLPLSKERSEGDANKGWGLLAYMANPYVFAVLGGLGDGGFDPSTGFGRGIKKFLPSIWYDQTSPQSVACGHIHHACITPVFERAGVAQQAGAEFVRQVKAIAAATEGIEVVSDEVSARGERDQVDRKYPRLMAQAPLNTTRAGTMGGIRLSADTGMRQYPPWPLDRGFSGSASYFYADSLLTTKQAYDATFHNLNQSHHRVQAWAYCEPKGGRCNSQEFFESECGAAWLNPVHTGMKLVSPNEEYFGRKALDLTLALGMFEKLEINPEAPLVDITIDPWEYVESMRGNVGLTCIYLIVVCPLVSALAMGCKAKVEQDGHNGPIPSWGPLLMMVLSFVNFMVFRCVYPILPVAKY